MRMLIHPALGSREESETNYFIRSIVSRTSLQQFLPLR